MATWSDYVAKVSIINSGLFYLGEEIRIEVRAAVIERRRNFCPGNASTTLHAAITSVAAITNRRFRRTAIPFRNTATRLPTSLPNNK